MAINATAVWRVRPSGNNLNGGGYDAGIGGAATDYSQQNAAQASGSNATCTTGTSTFVDATANAFTSAMVGNAIQIASGTNFIAGFYFVTAFTSASTVTLDRTPVTGSNGSVGVWKLGGGWADPVTNTTANIVPGNTVYVLGSGTPNPASYSTDYTISATVAIVQGNATAGLIIFANDPATPGYKAPPDTTGGMPLITLSLGGGSAIFNPSAYLGFKGIWFITGAANASVFGSSSFGSQCLLFGCVLDQKGSYLAICGNANTVRIFGCEHFSSSAAAVGNNGGVFNSGTEVVSCNIHDLTGDGYQFNAGGNGGVVANNIFAKCPQATSYAIQTFSGGATSNWMILNNTIDGNAGWGIWVDDQTSLAVTTIVNNIISNHTTAAKGGLLVNAGTTAANDRVKSYVDYNVFYNNTVNYSTISAGPHDTALGVSPYVASGTENYTLA